MYDRANEFFVRQANLYLGLMLLLGFGPWIVIFGRFAMASTPAPAWLLVLWLAIPMLTFAANAWMPMPAKEEEYQRRIERNYRLIRILFAVLMGAIAPLVVWQWQDLGLRPGQFAVFGSLMGFWAAGRHIRFRWHKPEREV